MDPETCIQRVADAIGNHNPSDAIKAIGDYYQWRLKGGAEPPNGDARVAKLMIAFAVIVEFM